MFISYRNLYRLLVSLSVMTITALIFYRSTNDELDKSNPNNYWFILNATLSILAGGNEAVELYDHLTDEGEEDIQKEEKQDNIKLERIEADNKDKQLVLSSSTVSTSSTSFSIQYPVGQLLVAGTSIPIIGSCLYAYLLQAKETTRMFYSEQNLYSCMITTVLAVPTLLKFARISIPHAWHALWGDREEYSLAVTNNKTINDSTGLTEKSAIPPLKWWAMLGVLTFLHIPEGRLLASPISNQLIKNLAKYGFALAEAIPLANQLEQLPKNLKDLRSESKEQLTTHFLAGFFAGAVHSSKSLLAIISHPESMLDFLSPTFEFIIGALEAQQHLVPKLNSYLFFNKAISNEEVESKQLEPIAFVKR